MDFVALAVVLGFFALIGLATGALAARKGYEFLPWFWAGGIIGLIFLAFQPDTKDPNLSDVNRRFLQERGNRLGWKLAVVSLALVVFRMVANS